MPRKVSGEEPCSHDRLPVHPRVYLQDLIGERFSREGLPAALLRQSVYGLLNSLELDDPLLPRGIVRSRELLRQPFATGNPELWPPLGIDDVGVISQFLWRSLSPECPHDCLTQRAV
jgi:hypothetical protein